VNKYPISLSCTSGEEKEGNDAADRLQQLAAQLEDSAQYWRSEFDLESKSINL